MDLTFANPAGFWALLGLPAVVAIHFLQRRSRRQVITTLFLLEKMRRESETGHRFERLRMSIPFWLQLLMVLGLTWLLVQPRWQREHSVQRVAVVVDASASMQPFREAATRALAAKLAVLAPAAATTEYTVLTSAPEAAALYHGTVRPDAEASLAGWNPWLGTHDLTPALRTARSLVGRDGIVILVSDHPPEEELPYAARYLLAGEALENVGWAGLTVEEVEGQPVFKALARNFGTAAQSREWWLEANGQKSPAAPLELAPGQSRTIQAAFPAGTDRVVLALAGDRFAADDRLPMVRPQPKELALALPGGDTPAAKDFRALFAAFPNTRLAASAAEADAVVIVYDPLSPALPEANACIFAGDPQPGATYLAGLVLAESGPLTDGLNWQSLLVRDTLGLPRTPNDRVLVWQGERPLIAERRTPGGHRHLLFNFDLQTSNARKLPALAIILHRFLASLRSEKIAPESLNVETHQKLTVAHRTEPTAPSLQLTADGSGEPGSAPGGDSVVAPAPVPRGALLRAPLEPGFFAVSQGPDRLLTAAAHFADPRESDFRAARTDDTLAGLTPTLVERHSEADSNWRLWLLLLVGTLVVSWFFTRS